MPLVTCRVAHCDVGQTFLSAGSGDFPVATPKAPAHWKVRCTGRQECPPYVTVLVAARSSGNNLHPNTPIRAKRNRSPVARHPRP